MRSRIPSLLILTALLAIGLCALKAQGPDNRARRGLGAGIPIGGLGDGISSGVTGGVIGPLSLSHDRHLRLIGFGHRGHTFLAIAHYRVWHFPPDLEPGTRAIYLQSRWVRTDRGKIRFTGGWVAVAEEVESVEPVWIPASWHESDGGSHVRVPGHWDFVESP